MKLTKTARKTIFGMLLILCLMLPLFANVSRADTGPKPSITVKVRNAPAEYYIALSGGGGHDRYTKDEISRLKKENPGEKEHQAIDKIFSLRIHITPVGKSCYRSDGHTYTFGYMVPSAFEVVIVSLDGEVYMSDTVWKKRYNAVFEYDVSTGEIHEIIKESRMLYASGAIGCYILTLIFEGLVLFAFKLASKKKNWIHFLIANTVTQIILNVYLVNNVTERDTSFFVLLYFLFIEVIICIIEAVYYGLTLRKKDGGKAGGMAVLYACTANTVSLVLGGLVYAKMWLEIFNIAY
ncbi:MAG: hypothetical protein J5738_08905 [Lachnospiraceae bacterium]|nr:hypothetical protein [Lachnospiraceae bacterium]